MVKSLPEVEQAIAQYEGHIRDLEKIIMTGSSQGQQTAKSKLKEVRNNLGLLLKQRSRLVSNLSGLGELALNSEPQKKYLVLGFIRNSTKSLTPKDFEKFVKNIGLSSKEGYDILFSAIRDKSTSKMIPKMAPRVLPPPTEDVIELQLLQTPLPKTQLQPPCSCSQEIPIYSLGNMGKEATPVWGLIGVIAAIGLLMSFSG